MKDKEKVSLSIGQPPERHLGVFLNNSIHVHKLYRSKWIITRNNKHKPCKVLKSLVEFSLLYPIHSTTNIIINLQFWAWIAFLQHRTKLWGNIIYHIAAPRAYPVIPCHKDGLQVKINTSLFCFWEEKERVKQDFKNLIFQLESWKNLI